MILFKQGPKVTCAPLVEYVYCVGTNQKNIMGLTKSVNNVSLEFRAALANNGMACGTKYTYFPIGLV